MAYRSSTLLALGFVASIGVASAVTAQAYPDTTQKTDTAAKTPPPPPPPAKPLGGLEFSSWLFGDLQWQTDETRKAANGGKTPSEFDLGRAYLTFRGPLGDKASFRITADIENFGNSGSPSDATNPFFGKGLIFRLKYGYLQYNFIQRPPDKGSLWGRVGMLHTVVIDYQEQFWPRYLQQTAVEKNGFMASADLGAAANWTLPGHWGEVYFTVVSGPGYTNPEPDRFRDFAVRLSLNPINRSDGILKTFSISPWYSAGENKSKFFDGDSTGAPPITDGLKKDRWGIFVGNKDPRLTFGLEYAQRIDDVESGAAEDVRTVTQVDGKLTDGFIVTRPFYNPKSNSAFGVVFRYDHFQPNQDLDPAQNFYVAGVFFEPTKKTAVAIDFQRNDPVNGLTTPRQDTWFFHWQAIF